MAWFERIERFYDDGYWTKEMVADAARAKKITTQEYEQITGEVFSA